MSDGESAPDGALSVQSRSARDGSAPDRVAILGLGSNGYGRGVAANSIILTTTTTIVQRIRLPLAEWHNARMPCDASGHFCYNTVAGRRFLLFTMKNECRK